MKEKASMRRRGVNAIRQTLELHAFLSQCPHQIDQPFDGAPKAIELPYNQDIAWAQVGSCLTQTKA
jgi:hypothetical protein